MQFLYTAPQTELEEFVGGHFHVSAIGKIDTGDDQKFLTFLERLSVPPRCMVYIDSVGGDVDAAMGIGKLIREAWFSTNIGRYQLDFENVNNTPIVRRKKRPGQCLSAATLLYLGGRLRYFDDTSIFGVHQFSFQTPAEIKKRIDFLADAQSLSARMSQYISSMGIGPEFLTLSASVKADAIRLVGRDELQKIGVVNGGQTSVVWSLEARNGISYVKGERDSLFGHHKVMLCYNREVGFSFWAVVEAQGRYRQLMGFTYVEIVIDGETKRFDISDHVFRAEVGNYVNFQSPISEEVARAIAYSDSFGIQIKMTREADMFLGISAMETTTGKMQLQTFFENHRK